MTFPSVTGSSSHLQAAASLHGLQDLLESRRLGVEPNAMGVLVDQSVKLFQSPPSDLCRASQHHRHPLVCSRL